MRDGPLRPDFAAKSVAARCRWSGDRYAVDATLTTLQQQGAVQVTLRRGTQPGFQAAPVS
jgi:hypothetical protein